MKGISFFLCEKVITRANGTYDVLNPWNTFQIVNPPIDATVCIFTHLAFEDSDAGDHVAKLMLIDPDKKESLLSHVSVVVSQTPFDWRFPFTVGVRIEKAGSYRFVLKMDKGKKAIIEAPIWIVPQKGASKGIQVGFQPSPPTPPAVAPAS